MHSLIYQLTHSLNGLRLLVSLVTVSIALLMLYLSWDLVREYHLSEAQIDRNVHQVILKAKVSTLESILRNYKQTIEHIAADSVTADQLQMSDEQEQEDWALDSRRYLGDSLGLALVQPDGSISGDPARLRIGPQCRADLARALAGEVLQNPLIHRDKKGFEHIDMLVPVTALDGAGGAVGYLFASFHLSVLTQRLDELVEPGYHMELTAGDGTVVAAAGQLAADLEPEDSETLSALIPGTELSLRLTRQLDGFSEFLKSLSVVLTLGLIALVAIPVIASCRFWALVKGDFCTLYEQLIEVGEGVRRPERPERPYLQDMEEIVDQTYALVARIGTTQSDLSHLSMHDHLTSLPNRRYIEEEILRTCAQVERGANFSVMMIDLDWFKQVNDRLGHDVGDDILRCFSDCVQNTLRSADFAGRWAGDEFVLICLLPHPAHETIYAVVDQLLLRVRRCFAEEQKILLGDAGIAVTLSIGRVTLVEGDVCEAPWVIQHADEALYKAKENGRNTLVDAPPLAEWSGETVKVD